MASAAACSSQRAGHAGLGDLAVLLGFNQTSAITAGSTDEAGNNAVNLLTKINSQDAANAAARVKYNGVTPLMLVKVSIVDKISCVDNPGISKLEKSWLIPLIVLTDKDYGSQAKLLEGSSVGQILRTASIDGSHCLPF
jgi:hypothetical protein